MRDWTNPKSEARKPHYAINNYGRTFVSRCIVTTMLAEDAMACTECGVVYRKEKVPDDGGFLTASLFTLTAIF